MGAEGTYLAFSLICGLVCAMLASDKGRSALWWFLVGAALTVLGVVFVALASDLKRLGSLEEELRRLQQDLGELGKEVGGLRFARAVTIGSSPSASICGSCDHFNQAFSICGAFRCEVGEPVVACREFTPKVESDEEGAEQTSRTSTEPPIPPIPPSQVRF